MRSRTANQIVWDKEVRRLRRFITRAEQRGFIFPERVLPERPRRVTEAALRRLRSLTPAALYGIASYADPETGVLLSGTEGRALERRRSALKAAATRRARRERARGPSIREAFWDMLMGMIDSAPSGGSKALNAFLMREVRLIGKDGVIDNLMRAREEALYLVEVIVYSSDRETIQASIDRLAEIIRGGPLSFAEKIENAIIEDSSGFDMEEMS